MILTILTPTLNCASTITHTLQSVCDLEKFFPGKIQQLIGDADSNDGTLDKIEKFRKSNKFIELSFHPEQNIPATLNTLLKKAQGEYIIVLNGDDYLNSKALKNILVELAQSRFKGIVCGHVSICDELGKLKGERCVKLKDIHRYMSVNHPAMIVHKSNFEIVGTFNEFTPTAYDYVWAWDASRKGVKFVHSRATLAYVRLGGLSHTRAEIAAKEILNHKIKSGDIYFAVMGFVSFKVKRILKNILPERGFYFLSSIYRRMKSSIDKY